MVVAEKNISEIIQAHKATLRTPYYLIDEQQLLKNLEKIAEVKKKSGAKSVLALKCFSTWSVFDLMRDYMDGTTSSSLYEAKLGHEKFGKEVHAYSVGFSQDEIEEVRNFATKIIFNSTSQLKRFLPLVGDVPLGLRINPGVSHSHFDLADPARRYCRLGATNEKEILDVLPSVSGAMFHCNCENDDFGKFSSILDHIGKKFGPLLKKLKWVSLGGGLYFTKEGYPLEKFCERLARFANEFDVQVYLEPGESSITQCGYLVTTVLDVVHNEIDNAIVDSAVETHMPDLMIYHSDAKVAGAQKKGVPVMVTGRTCLAGDVFGTYHFPEPLKVGDTVTFLDAAGYTLVKKNWFNGIKMPSIVVRRLNGRVELVKSFTYEDFVANLS
ncbi:MAG: Carboxynorspermidine/carboxyspermidine decarboxylase [Elusimicrobia bacterium]|nr:Carboxynorspermidine/carboxyspermidine decarboxylase [Elusimicrobiota bacterium]